MTRPLIIGIDAGGTKTAGALAVAEAAGVGEELARTRVGATNPHSVGYDVAEARLGELRDALQASAPKGAGIAAVALCAAGVDRPEDEARLTDALGRIFPGASHFVSNDAVAGLAGALGELRGINVISGTGSIALGAWGGRETIVRCGGWGHLLGDEGGGYQLGLMALRALCKSADGRQGNTLMTRLVLGDLGLAEPSGLIGWMLGHDNDKAKVAALSRHVLTAAEAGDAAAAAIAEWNAGELALLAATVRGKLAAPGDADVPLVTTGGNLTNSPYYRWLFLDRLTATGAAVRVVESKGDPTSGALFLAWQHWASAQK